MNRNWRYQSALFLIAIEDLALNQHDKASNEMLKLIYFTTTVQKQYLFVDSTNSNLFGVHDFYVLLTF